MAKVFPLEVYGNQFGPETKVTVTTESGSVYELMRLDTEKGVQAALADSERKLVKDEDGNQLIIRRNAGAYLRYPGDKPINQVVITSPKNRGLFGVPLRGIKRRRGLDLMGAMGVSTSGIRSIEAENLIPDFLTSKVRDLVRELLTEVDFLSFEKEQQEEIAALAEGGTVDPTIFTRQDKEMPSRVDWGASVLGHTLYREAKLGVVSPRFSSEKVDQIADSLGPYAFYHFFSPVGAMRSFEKVTFCVNSVYDNLPVHYSIHSTQLVLTAELNSLDIEKLS